MSKFIIELTNEWELTQIHRECENQQRISVTIALALLNCYGPSTPALLDDMRAFIETLEPTPKNFRDGT